MSRKSCPWWKGHDWKETGYDGLLTVRYDCTRCPRIRIFNGATGETDEYEPRPVKETA